MRILLAVLLTLLGTASLAQPRKHDPKGPHHGPPGGRAMPSGPITFAAAPVPRDAAEKKILAVLNTMGRRATPDAANVPERDGRTLRLLAESIGARHVVELGTSTGYSAIWICLALRQTKGKLTTFEIDRQRAATARARFKEAGVAALITLVEGDAHEKVKALKEPIDLLFLDADKEGYLDYLTKLWPLLRRGGLVVAHNMNQHQADPRYVKAVTTRPDAETVFLNLPDGIGVTLKKR
jgi:caffeoyl-CoA O-methyltransferase